MKASQGIKELIKHFEGLKLSAYPDPKTGGAPWTIGYGHTKGVKKGDRCTIEEANAFLDEDVIDCENSIKKLVRSQLNQSQFDALVSFVFNLGETKFRGSTLLHYLNAGDLKKAALEFVRWKYPIELKGILRRRQAETAWFNKEDTHGTA